MNKLFAALFTTGALLMSGDASADTTVINSIGPHQAIYVPVDLPIGKSTVEIWAAGNEKISCRLITRASNKLVYLADATQRCVGYTPNLVLPAYVYAVVVNDNDKAIATTIWLHESK